MFNYTVYKLTANTYQRAPFNFQRATGWFSTVIQYDIPG